MNSFGALERDVGLMLLQCGCALKHYAKGKTQLQEGHSVCCFLHAVNRSDYWIAMV